MEPQVSGSTPDFPSQNRKVIGMGIYYGVDKVKELGTRVKKTQVHPEIPKDHVLVVVPTTGLWEIAGDVTRPSEFEAFMSAYNNGTYLDFELYQVSQENIQQCPDQGRKYRS